MVPRVAITLALAVPAGSVAPAQALQPQSAESLLHTLAANAATYEAHLPSLSCREHITSQYISDGKVLRAVDVDDFLRVMRNVHANDPKVEKRVPVNAAGEPDEQSAMPPMPTVLSNGFFRGQAAFLNAERSSQCLEMSVDTSGSKIHLSLRRKSHPPAGADCDATPDDLHHDTLIDRATGQAVFVRQSIDLGYALRLAREKHEYRATQVEITYAPVKFDNETFWLPSRIYGEFGAHNRYTATYSGCKRFTTKSRIVTTGPAE